MEPVKKKVLSFDDVPEVGKEKPAVAASGKKVVSFDDIPVTPVEDRRDSRGVPGSSDPMYGKRISDVRAGLESYGMGKINELPEPDDSMYNSLDLRTEEGYQEARKLYDAYRNHPDAGTGVLGPIYKNRYVPLPSPGTTSLGGIFDGGADDAQWVLGHISNAGKELGKTIAAGFDTYMEQTSNWNPGTTQWIEENIPEYTSTGLKELGGVAIETGIGMLAGRAATGTMGGPNIPAAERAISYGLAAIGAALTIDSETPALFAGDDAVLFNVEKVWNSETGQEEPKLSYNEEVGLQKIRLAAESLVVGGIVDSTAAGLGVVANFLKNTVAKPIGNVFSTAGKETSAIQDIMEVFNVDPNNRESMLRLKEILDKYGVLSKEINVGTKEQANIERTTMSAIEEGIGDVRPELGRQAMEAEQAQLNRGSPKLREKITQPTREIQDIQEQATIQYGGKQTADEAGGEIADVGIRDIEKLRSDTEQFSQILKQEEAELYTELRNNPVVGDTIKKLEDASGVTIWTNQNTTEAEGALVGKVEQAISALDQKRKDLYAAIPDDVGIDYESLDEAILGTEGLLPKTLKAKLFDTEGNVKEGLDFKTLHNEVVPQLSGLISRYKSSNPPNWDAVDSLIQLRKNITEDQIDYIINTGGLGEEAALAANEARAWYRDVYSKMANEGPLEDLFDIYHIKSLSERPFNQKGIDTTKSVLKEGKRADTEQLYQLFDSANMVEDKNAIKDLITARWNDRILERVTSEGLEKLDENKLLSIFKEEAGIISRNHPEIAQALNDDIQSFFSRKKTVGQITKDLEEFQKESKLLEEDVMSSFLGKFLDRSGGTKTLSKKPNGYAVIADIISNKQGLTDIQNIMDLATKEGNPLITQGVKGAFMKYLDNGMFGGVNTFNQKVAREFLDPSGDIYAKAKIIFQDEPETLDTLYGILAAGYNETVKRNKTGQLEIINPNQFGVEAGRGVDFLITQTLGVLNRVAARARSVTKTVLKQYDPADAAMAIADEVFANPKFASELLQREITKLDKSLGGSTSPEFKKLVTRALARSGMVDWKTETGERDFLAEWAKLEQTAKKDAKDEDLEKQTMEALSP